MNFVQRSEKGGGDRRYLTQPRGAGSTWYVVAEVPRTLQSVLGKKRLLKSLETDDLRAARVARWNVLAILKTQIAQCRASTSKDKDPLLLEAMAFREEFVRADAARRNQLMDEITDRAEEIDLAGGGAGARDDYDPLDDERATAIKPAVDFAQLATGKATPADIYLERWLSSSTYSDRTKADARTAMSQFKAWCEKVSQAFFIETTSDRIASNFRDEVFVQAKRTPRRQTRSCLRCVNIGNGWIEALPCGPTRGCASRCRKLRLTELPRMARTVPKDPSRTKRSGPCWLARPTSIYRM